MSLLAVLVLTVLSLNNNHAEALLILAKKLVGNISCDVLRIAYPAKISFTATKGRS